MSGRVPEMPSGHTRWSRMKRYETTAAYFETELAQVQAYTSSEASHDHSEISIRVEDHHILPVERIFADIDVDLDVHLTRLFWDRHSISGKRRDNVCEAQCKIVGALAVRLPAGYASGRSKRTFDFFMSNGGERTGDYKVYIPMVLLLRCFVGNADVLEQRSETRQKS
jgi:hypothetical protein